MKGPYNKETVDAQVVDRNSKHGNHACIRNNKEQRIEMKAKLIKYIFTTE